MELVFIIYIHVQYVHQSAECDFLIDTVLKIKMCLSKVDTHGIFGDNVEDVLWIGLLCSSPGVHVS